MIKADKGYMKITGERIDIMTELTMIIESIGSMMEYSETFEQMIDHAMRRGKIIYLMNKKCVTKEKIEEQFTFMNDREKEIIFEAVEENRQRKWKV
jgi:homoserine dehydrogenase